MTAADPQVLALQPVRDALLARARRDAARLRSAAEADGQRLLAAAHAEADQLLADARAQGEAEAVAQLEVDRARTRRAARAVVLEAQRAVYDELRASARVAVQELLSDPSRRARLRAELRRRLGPAADVQDSPDGGLVARTPDGRGVDASVEALVDRALSDLDLDPLWAPA